MTTPALAQEGEGRALVRSSQGVELISNVCRHRCRDAQGPGQQRSNIVCPLHRWTYSHQGELIGAPHFADDPCLNLQRDPLREWNGLFEDNGHDVAAHLQQLGPRAKLDFRAMCSTRCRPMSATTTGRPSSRSTLRTTTLAPFHPGLGQFVSREDLAWEFGKHHSVQTVGVSPGFGRPGSGVYGRWHEQLLKYCQGRLPEAGAVY